MEAGSERSVMPENIMNFNVYSHMNFTCLVMHLSLRFFLIQVALLTPGLFISYVKSTQEKIY